MAETKVIQDKSVGLCLGTSRDKSIQSSVVRQWMDNPVELERSWFSSDDQLEKNWSDVANSVFAIFMELTQKGVIFK